MLNKTIATMSTIRPLAVQIDSVCFFLRDSEIGAFSLAFCFIAEPVLPFSRDLVAFEETAEADEDWGLGSGFILSAGGTSPSIGVAGVHQ